MQLMIAALIKIGFIGMQLLIAALIRRGFKFGMQLMGCTSD
jgi:hypothetical protein